MLLVYKGGDERAESAAEYLRLHFGNLTTLPAARGAPIPDTLTWWTGDYLISYLCPWVIPASTLVNAHIAAINFHPGPPEYPGIGCTNFAIYDDAPDFGVTCHLMKPKVDTGIIVKAKYFPVYESDTVYSLTQRCYAHIQDLFYEIIDTILQDKPLPMSPLNWTREAYTRKELNALCRITPDMDETEIKRRIRAVTYPGAPGAYVELAGHRFVA